MPNERAARTVSDAVPEDRFRVPRCQHRKRKRTLCANQWMVSVVANRTWFPRPPAKIQVSHQRDCLSKAKYIRLIVARDFQLVLGLVQQIVQQNHRARAVARVGCQHRSTPRMPCSKDLHADVLRSDRTPQSFHLAKKVLRGREWALASQFGSVGLTQCALSATTRGAHPRQELLLRTLLALARCTPRRELARCSVQRGNVGLDLLLLRSTAVLALTQPHTRLGPTKLCVVFGLPPAAGKRLPLGWVLTAVDMRINSALELPLIDGELQDHAQGTANVNPRNSTPSPRWSGFLYQAKRPTASSLTVTSVNHGDQCHRVQAHAPVLPSFFLTAVVSSA